LPLSRLHERHQIVDAVRQRAERQPESRIGKPARNAPAP
jgi:hypothetical protein